MKCWTEFSHIQSELSANGVVSNLCDWAIRNGRRLLLKVVKTWNWQFRRTSEWIQTNIVSHKSSHEAITIFSQIDHPKLLPLPLLKIAKIWNRRYLMIYPMDFAKYVSYWCFHWILKVEVQSRCDIAFRRILVHDKWFKWWFTVFCLNCILETFHWKLGGKWVMKVSRHPRTHFFYQATYAKHIS